MNSPLVSILVITYNSSQYILETLESAKNQTYENIELIISDDFSTDNTYNLCKDWMDKNNKYFASSVLIKTPENKGISGNCNHGLKFCSGDWVKLIAGDDILLPDCISSYVTHAEASNSKFVFSLPQIIMPNGSPQEIQKKEEAYKAQSAFFNLNAIEQHRHMLIQGLPMSASTFFFSNSELKRVGGFDENFMQEDRPLYLKLTKLGYRLDYIGENLVQYRIHPENTSTKNKKDTPVNEFWFKRVHNVTRSYVDLDLLINAPLVYIEYYNRYYVNKIAMAFGNTYKSFRFLRKLRYLSPIYFQYHILKKKTW